MPRKTYPRSRLWRKAGLAVCAALLVGLTPGRCAQAMQLASGSYIGNGTVNRAIADVGFQPDVVIIKGNAAQLAVMRTSTMAGDAAKELVGTIALQTNRIRSLDPSGFTVGTDAEVNGSGIGYTWVAFRSDAAGDLRVGSYAGSGVDKRSIRGVGFQPSYVIVLPAGPQRAVHRSSAMDGDVTLPFADAGAKPNYIQALEADGFQVGDNATVNTVGMTYHYVAWKAVAGSMNVGSYTGDGSDDRSIVGTGFRPDYLIVKARVKETAVHRTARMAGERALAFSAEANRPDAIQALGADGFRVGAAKSVNEPKTKYFWVAFRAPGSISSSGRLAITAVNGGANPTAGNPFSVVVQARDAAGLGGNVTTPTGVSLSLRAGTGSLGGTLTGTIPAGASQVTIEGVTYTKAQGDIILTANRTSGDSLAPGDSAPFAVDPGAIARYTVNLASPQPAGSTFAVAAMALDQLGNPVTTDSSTVVALTSSSGHVLFDGNMDGTFDDNTGTLSAGALSMNARGTVAETTTVIATDTDGRMGSASLTIEPGTASTLAFTVQPGNAATGSPIPGPPTIAVQDGLGNTVTSSKASITVSLGANPGGGTLEGKTSKSAKDSVATFSDLTISQPGSGYTLTASSAGFTGVTSAPFTITIVTGALAGTVSAANDGHRLSGARIEALQAGLVKASTITGADGTYAMLSLSPGSYDVRASAAGYQSLTSAGVTVSGERTSAVNFSLDASPELAIRITAPATGTVLNEPATLAQGEVSGTAAPGVTLTVSTSLQGQPIDLPVPVQINGGRFAALVGLTPGDVQLVARATDSTGRSTQDSITITFQPDPPDYDQAAPPDVKPTVGFAPLTVTFGGTEAADPTVTTLDLDVDGDGRPDFTLPNFAAPPHQVTYTYLTEGLYIATIVVRDQAGQSRSTRVPINVLPMPDLPPVWDAFRAALARGDVDGAAGFVALEARERYRRVFSDLQADLPSIAAAMAAITPAVITPEYATASCTRIRDGVSEAFLIHFLRDGDGVWRIASM